MASQEMTSNYIHMTAAQKNLTTDNHGSSRIEGIITNIDRRKPQPLLQITHSILNSEIELTYQ